MSRNSKRPPDEESEFVRRKKATVNDPSLVFSRLSLISNTGFEEEVDLIAVSGDPCGPGVNEFRSKFVL